MSNRKEILIKKYLEFKQHLDSIEFNTSLNNNPELINSDPYGEGWVIKMKPSDLGDISHLMDVETYKSFIAH